MQEEITFKFSVEKVNVLLKGLSELPAKESFGLINEIYQNVERHNKENVPSKEKVKK